MKGLQTEAAGVPPIDQMRRALVVILRHHGDVLLASPVLTVLKNHAPRLEIDALAYADTAPMLSLHPALSRLHTIDRNWKKAGVLPRAREEWKLLRVLRERRYDLLIHLTEHPRGAWLARVLGAACAVAPRKPGAGRLWTKSFTHLVHKPSNARRHTVERNLDALRRIGIQPGTHERRLTLVSGDPAEGRIDELLTRHGLKAGSYALLHPASRWLFKCWTAEANAGLVRWLASRGLRTVLTGAPDAREQGMVEDILARAQVADAVNLAGQLSLKELAALVARARIFVGVDSAPMHIAAAMGTPSVVLFGPSGELEWAPWQVRHVLIASERHPCRPCGTDGCGGGKVSECLTTIDVEQVTAAVESLLNQ